MVGRNNFVFFFILVVVIYLFEVCDFVGLLLKFLSICFNMMSIIEILKLYDFFDIMFNVLFLFNFICLIKVKFLFFFMMSFSFIILI